MKIIQYFLIILIFSIILMFFISASGLDVGITVYWDRKDAKSAQTNDQETNKTSEEYQLIKEYRETLCAFIDKNTDYKIQTRCFDITKKLFKLSGNKIFLGSLACHYVNGFGVAKDLNKGLKFYEEVANSDSKIALEAQYNLGIWYIAEDSPVKDDVKGEYWVKKAALNGSALSQYDYANLLKNQGKVKESVYWYKKSSSNGYLLAKYKLANLFRKGCPVAINRKQAYKLLNDAAKQDYALAFQELSLFYKEDGNKEQSNYWWCKFINSDFFKKVQLGIDPDDAINQIYFEQKKEKYILEVQKEIEQTERINKTSSYSYKAFDLIRFNDENLDAGITVYWKGAQH